MILILVFLVYFIPSVDPDLGWYIRTGTEFFKTGQIPFHNTFTYFLEGYRFINPYSLYAIITAFVYQILGQWGLAGIFAFLMVLSFFLVGKIFPGAKTIILSLLFLSFLPVYNQFLLGLRSQIITIVGLVIAYYICLTKRSYKRGFVLSAILFMLWSNTHGGFPIGLVIFVAALINAVTGKNYKDSKYFLSLLVGGLFGSVINPFGISLYAWTLKHFQIPLNTMIAEWTVPGIIPTMVIAVVTFIIAIVILSVPHKRKFFWLLLLVMFSYLSLRANRNIVLFFLTVVLLTADYGYTWFIRLEKNWKIRRTVNIVIIIGIVITGYILIDRNIGVITNSNRYCNNEFSTYPCGVVSYISNNPLSVDNIFAPYEWGGYLEWKLPHYKYFTDGRMVVWESPYNESPYLTNLKIMQAQKGYQDILDQYNTQALLIPSGSFLDLDIQNKKSWREIYRDNLSVIYISE